MASPRERMTSYHDTIQAHEPPLSAQTGSPTNLPPDRSPGIEQLEWSGWEKWLRGHLDIERQNLIEALGEALSQSRFDLRNEIEAKINAQVKALELRIAKLTGAVDILRGIQPPPPAKFLTIRAWREDTIYHEGDIVAFGGGTFQALRDTARAPGVRDWVCLASPGNSLSMRGTNDDHADYRCLDVTMINGSSFVALKDKPGPCPGADWHLLASRGSRGDRGRWRAGSIRNALNFRRSAIAALVRSP